MTPSQMTRIAELEMELLKTAEQRDDALKELTQVRAYWEAAKFEVGELQPLAVKLQKREHGRLFPHGDHVGTFETCPNDDCKLARGEH